MLASLHLQRQFWLREALRFTEELHWDGSESALRTSDPPAVTPYDIVYEGGRVRLRHYRPVEPSQSTPVLLVYALLKRPYILDLLPERSVVQTFVRQGFHVYLTDWIPPTEADRGRGFDAYVNGDLANAVRAVQVRAGVERVSLLGYCLGGLLAVMYTTLHPETVQNLIVFALPLDMHSRTIPFSGLAAPFLRGAVEFITALYGNCPAWLIKAGVTALVPTRLCLPLYLRRDLREPEIGKAGWITAPPVQQALEPWMNSDVPLAGQLFREWMIDIFQRNLLTQNRLQVGSQTVTLQHIACPVLNIIGEYDDVVPPPASLPFSALVGSRDARNLVFPTGHLGLVASRAAHEKLWPEVNRWLKEREHSKAAGM
jgi:polyhydroxyalkanoate synthase